MCSELYVSLFAIVSGIIDDTLMCHWHVKVLWKQDWPF